MVSRWLDGRTIIEELGIQRSKDGMRLVRIRSREPINPEGKNGEKIEAVSRLVGEGQMLKIEGTDP